MGFIDLKKVYDMVNKEVLGQVFNIHDSEPFNIDGTTVPSDFGVTGQSFASP